MGLPICAAVWLNWRCRPFESAGIGWRQRCRQIEFGRSLRGDGQARRCDAAVVWRAGQNADRSLAALTVGSDGAGQNCAKRRSATVGDSAAGYGGRLATARGSWRYAGSDADDRGRRTQWPAGGRTRKIGRDIGGTKLSRSAKFDAKTAVQIGKLIGAKRVIVGNIAEFDGKLAIDVRIVDCATAKVLAASHADCALELEALRKAVALLVNGIN